MTAGSKQREFPWQWPHAPAHWVFEPGIYMVTASTYKKVPYLNTPARKDFFQNALFSISAEFSWRLLAWAILGNHYHFIAVSPNDPETLRRLIGKLHMTTAKEFNRRDKTPGRKIWFQYWDTRITYQKSFLTRLKYVNNNPVKHGLAENAEAYRWCSAAWFNLNAPRSFVETVRQFKIDRVNVYDYF
jgi:putative transposase